MHVPSLERAIARGAWLAAGAAVVVVQPAAGQVASAPSAGTGAAWASQVIEQYAGRIESDVEADGLGGITAGVVPGPDVVWVEGFGWADRERAIPATPEAVYRIGSISKTVTAALLMRLVDQEVVSRGGSRRPAPCSVCR